MKKTTTFLIMLMVILTTFGTTNLVSRYTGTNILIGNVSADVNQSDLDTLLDDIDSLVEGYMDDLWIQISQALTENFTIVSDDTATILLVLGEYSVNETLKNQLEAINTSINSFIFENVTNASVMARLNTILERIEGSGDSVGNWSIYDTQNYILRGLIDKDENYILHNGTLAYLEGTSVLKGVLANQVVLSEQDGMLAELIRNSTQSIVTVSDENKIAMQESLVAVGKQIIDSSGLTTWLIGAILCIIIIFLIWKFLKERKETGNKSSDGYPACYKDLKTFNRLDCKGCLLIDDCERAIIGSEAISEKQDCFGRQYLESAAACKKCKDREECRATMPWEATPEQQDPAPAAANPLDAM